MFNLAFSKEIRYVLVRCGWCLVSRKLYPIFFNHLVYTKYHAELKNIDIIFIISKKAVKQASESLQTVAATAVIHLRVRQISGWNFVDRLHGNTPWLMSQKF